MLEIQRIGADRWQVFRNLRLAALADAPYAFASRLDKERELSETDWRDRATSRTQFVALLDGTPVGLVGVRPEEGDHVQVVSMWVAPEARGTGASDRLLAAAIDEAKASGSASVGLWVSDGNTPAERLYARHGFARSGNVQPIDDEDPSRGMEFEMRLSLPQP